MKRTDIAVVACLALFAWIGFLFMRGRSDTTVPATLHAPDVEAGELAFPGVPPAGDPLLETGREDVRLLHLSLGNFLLAMKDPNRPPLGDNFDITRALTGGNRMRRVFIDTNRFPVISGRLVDAWGTPYWFHARARDAIDVVSAGPDRELFTADDLAVGPR